MTISHSNITHLSGKYPDQGIVTCNHGYHTEDGDVTYNISCGADTDGSGVGGWSYGEWFGIKPCVGRCGICTHSSNRTLVNRAELTVKVGVY